MVESKRKSRKTERSVREGQWLIAEMDRLGLKSADVARLLALETENLVSQWRKGYCAIPDLYLLKLGRLLSADVYQLRPSLLEYVDAIADRPLLAGLGKAEIEQITNIISLFRGGKAERIVKPKAAESAKILKLPPKEA